MDCLLSNVLFKIIMKHKLISTQWLEDVSEIEED